MDLLKMYGTQKEFSDRLNIRVPKKNVLVALNVEISECINAVQVWKWWKTSAVCDKEKVLDELADVYAFWLTLLVTDSYNEKQSPDFIEIKRNDVCALLFNKIRNCCDMDIPVTDLQYVPITSLTDISTISTTAIAKLTAYVIKMTGATYEEIEDAYYKKMNTNHKRQDDHY